MSRVASSLTTNADHSMYDARGYSITTISWIHFIADGRRCLYFINSNWYCAQRGAIYGILFVLPNTVLFRLMCRQQGCTRL